MQDDPGLVFDRVAEEYDRVRPSYPTELVEAACELLGIEGGSRVLEIGSGTGKLTRSLVDRGLIVDAVDPGQDMVAVARRNVPESAAGFRVGRFEDVDLPACSFDGAFSASAFHWIDPNVGWAKVAALLRPDAGFALLTHTVDADEGVLEAWRAVLPEAATWVSRDAESLRAGVEARRRNLSEVWSWLTRHELGRPEAAELFSAVDVSWVPVDVSVTSEELVAETRTTSMYLRLAPERQRELEERLRAFVERQGGTYRPTTFAVAAVARRR